MGLFSYSTWKFFHDSIWFMPTENEQRGGNEEKSSRCQQPRLKFNNSPWRHLSPSCSAPLGAGQQTIEELNEMFNGETTITIRSHRKSLLEANKTTITMISCGRFNQSSLWETHFPIKNEAFMFVWSQINLWFIHIGNFMLWNVLEDI